MIAVAVSGTGFPSFGVESDHPLSLKPGDTQRRPATLTLPVGDPR